MYVKSVHFKNVKAFADVEFEFGHEGKYAGWNVFVGGNASGKSTVLKGIALALAGPECGNRLMLTIDGWIRQGELSGIVSVELERDQEHDKFSNGSKAKRETLEAAVEWSKPSLDATEVFRKAESKGKSHLVAGSGPWDVNARGWFYAGYGPMRRLTGSSSEALSYARGGGVVSRMLTLFREDAALSESETWLKNKHSEFLEASEILYRRLPKVLKQKGRELLWFEVEDAFQFNKELPQEQHNELISIINQDDELRSGKQRLEKERFTGELLDGARGFLNDGLLPHNLKITRVSVEHVMLKGEDGVELPMRDLSDGCRTVYALVLDLTHHFSEVYGANDLFEQNSEGRWHINKPGVVLLDEVEAHLHPSWQQTLPEWLKAHFPQVQFIVSTHSPLIVQAADPGGVYVLPLQNEVGRKPRRLTDQEYWKIKLGRAEKILLGSAFGLQHSRSNWANAQIERWQWLDAKLDEGEKLTPKERAEYNKLEKQMDVIFEPVWEEEIK